MLGPHCALGNFMCFSATASFTAAAILLPAGAYCLATARRIDFRWIPLAVYPIVFSIQQAIEGILWIGFNAGDQTTIAAASRGFLFFSHLFWLAWIPFSVYWLGGETWRRRLLLALTIVGALFGLSIFLPSFLIADWLSVEQAWHSLEYRTVLIYEGIVNRTVLRGIYALIIVSALLLAPNPQVRTFGGLIAASLIVAFLFFAHAFISVWCFLAAVLSSYVVIILVIERRRQVADT